MSKRKKPKIAQQLKENIEDIYGLTEKEVQTKSEAMLMYLERMLKPENILVFIATMFFLGLSLVFTVQSGTGIDPNYISMIVGALATGIAFLSKMGIVRGERKSELELSNSLMKKEMEYEKVSRELDIKESMYDFFAKELIGLIGRCDKDRLESINLALSALVLDKGGLPQKEIKQLQALLIQRDQKEEQLLKALSDVQNIVVKPTDENFAQELEELEEQVITGKWEYEQLMENLSVSVIVLDRHGVIRELNKHASQTIPGLVEKIDRHWTYKTEQAPAEQLRIMTSVINRTLDGETIEREIKDYQFADGMEADIVLRTAARVKDGNIVGGILMLEIQEDKIDVPPTPDEERTTLFDELKDLTGEKNSNN